MELLQHFPEFPERSQLCEVYPNFPKLFPYNFLSIHLCSRNFKNFRMVRISDIQQIPESFLGNFCTIFLCFQILESFSSMESAQSFHYFSRRLHVHPSSQSGNTLLIITRLLCSARLNLQFSDNYLVGQGIRESIPRCDQFCFFWRSECCSCLHTVANRFFNAVCSTKVKWKEVNIVLCLLDVKTK